MSYFIRYAGRDDAALIADISHQTFYDSFAAANRPEDMHKFLNEQFTRGKLMLEVGAAENTFLLAYAVHELAGYAKLRESRPPKSLGCDKAMELARLYAVRSYIGQGVGKMLMQACLETAKQKGYDTVWLGVWKTNQRAIDFYTRWGFEAFDEADFLLGDDVQRDWLMKKTI